MAVLAASKALPVDADCAYVDILPVFAWLRASCEKGPSRPGSSFVPLSVARGGGMFASYEENSIPGNLSGRESGFRGLFAGRRGNRAAPQIRTGGC